MQCLQCGREVGNWMKTCGQCGAPLQQAATIPAAPPRLVAPPVQPRPAPALPPLGRKRSWPRWLTALLLLLATGLVVVVVGIIALVSYMKTPLLQHPQADVYRWGPRAWGGSRDVNAAIFFDNGTAATLTIKVEGQGEFAVGGRQRVKLEEPAGPIVFTVSAPAASIATTMPIDGQFRENLGSGHVYVYNPLAHFDYQIESHLYSTLSFLPFDPPAPKVITGMTFFDAGNIDFAFEPAPSTVALSGPPGAVASATKYSLSHKEKEP